LYSSPWILSVETVFAEAPLPTTWEVAETSIPLLPVTSNCESIAGNPFTWPVVL
jgi:hypothetical protein